MKWTGQVVREDGWFAGAVVRQVTHLHGWFAGAVVRHVTQLHGWYARASGESGWLTR